MELSDSYWDRYIKPIRSTSVNKVCALILEPIIQGAGGMLCYSADFLKKLASLGKIKKYLFDC